MKKMTFKDYVESKSIELVSERSFEIKRIADACAVDISTVYRWIAGKSCPDYLKIQKISEMTSIPPEQLFPAKK